MERHLFVPQIPHQIRINFVAYVNYPDFCVLIFYLSLIIVFTSGDSHS